MLTLKCGCAWSVLLSLGLLGPDTLVRSLLSFSLQPQSHDIATGDGQSLSAATNPEGEVSLSAHVPFTVDDMLQLTYATNLYFNCLFKDQEMLNIGRWVKNERKSTENSQVLPVGYVVLQSLIRQIEIMCKIVFIFTAAEDISNMHSVTWINKKLLFSWYSW